jgi:Arc/MetJ family transcription regulator
MARTNIVLDENLVDACRKATGIKTQRALIDHALRELLRRENQKKILELRGTVKWEGDLAEMRKMRTFESPSPKAIRESLAAVGAAPAGKRESRREPRGRRPPRKAAQ